MMVTFVSQCEKKAINKTRRVLDSFANRIGSRTWQTVITSEGLNAVKKNLRRTASKNTAVSCHWLRSRSRSELVWIVGNRRKFNEQGIVPVNHTQKSILNNHWEDDWQYLPLIRTLTSLAALFHDWGKASEFFQTKLTQHAGKKIGDPLRHEWISVLLLKAFIDNEEDEQWLTRLANGDIDESLLKAEGHDNNPLYKLPEAAGILAWLVLSHHRLPVPKDNDHEGKKAIDINDTFYWIVDDWGYKNEFKNFKNDLPRCKYFPNGLPNQSKQWLKRAKRWGAKLLDLLPKLRNSIEDGSIRIILQHSRLCLMLGDHYYSSLPGNSKQRIKYQDTRLLANTDNKTKLPKQYLDEHLMGVQQTALNIVNFLPAFEGTHEELDSVKDNQALKQKSPHIDFKWQDIAVSKINRWRTGLVEKLNPHQFGFFAVNMASTGKGKTFANAKIMRALSLDGKRLRFILALGLRTLTLQTGTEYRTRIGLDEEDLAILIGSRAIMDLYEANQKRNKDEDEQDSGSESEEKLIDNELIYDSKIPDDKFETVLQNTKHRKFLYASVISCTIDHLMAATETKRGGRYILPTLRLMSSDLVIDEIDDFDGKDLIAIGRLIHLAGMLGRKVMISSATIPPDLAEGYYNAYQAGWKIFAQSRNRSSSIGCAWIDEFGSLVESIHASNDIQQLANYKKCHQQFVSDRIKELAKQVVKRRANIFPLKQPDQNELQETVKEVFFSAIQTAIVEKHQNHGNTDEISSKKVSFGVVRIANINPCIELTRYLLNADWPENIEIRAMAYHSQQILIMRNEQEVHLDEVLNRKKGYQSSFNHPLIRRHIQQSAAKNIIFILVATPVEEVGRDHCLDWAVVEASSYRSIIQLAGRILRHLQMTNDLSRPNMTILQYNLKALMHQKPAYTHPGYESNENPLSSHDLFQLLDHESIQQRIDASPRISKPKNLDPENNLADLEHNTIHKLLTLYDKKGPESMQGWLDSYWWLTAVPQLCVPFRESSPQLTLYYYPVEEDKWRFVEKDKQGKATPYREEQYGIKIDKNLSEPEQERLWLIRDYPQLLEPMLKHNLKYTALIYGELGFPMYSDEDSNDLSYSYSSQFGLMKTKTA